MGCFFDETWLRYCEMDKNELDEIDRKTSKFMTMNKELQPRSHVDRLYVSRTERGTGLIGCKMCVKEDENSLGWYVKHYI